MKWRRVVSCVLPLLAFLAGCTSTRGQASVRVRTPRFEKSVASWKDKLLDHVVVQNTDYSCGAASLATLMRFYFEDEVYEDDVLKEILAHLSEEELQERQRNGLSLLDLRNASQRMGYQTEGVRLTISALRQLRGPVLVHLESDEYQHFAILRGIRGDRVYLADPSRGNVRMPLVRFESEWSGAVLVLGKPSFGLPSMHPLSIEQDAPIRPELDAARRFIYLRR